MERNPHLLRRQTTQASLQSTAPSALEARRRNPAAAPDRHCSGSLQNVDSFAHQLPGSRLSVDHRSEHFPKKLLQHYFDRWQIEVNHRDEKTILAVGHSHVWSPLSVPRQPAFTVALYSLLLLACLRCTGPGRTSDFPPLPKWRKTPANRPSLQDLLTLLRKNFCETSVSSMLDANFAKNLTLYSKT